MEPFFGDMQFSAVRDIAVEVYAPEAYPHDNIAVVEGADAIGEYFAGTLERVQGLRVSFLDIAHTGPDYFVRWQMSVASKEINNGQPMVSCVITHFRCDGRGRILLPRVRAAAEGGS